MDECWIILVGLQEMIMNRWLKLSMKQEVRYSYLRERNVETGTSDNYRWAAGMLTRPELTSSVPSSAPPLNVSLSTSTGWHLLVNRPPVAMYWRNQQAVCIQTASGKLIEDGSYLVWNNHHLKEDQRLIWRDVIEPVDVLRDFGVMLD